MTLYTNFDAQNSEKIAPKITEKLRMFKKIKNQIKNKCKNSYFIFLLLLLASCSESSPLETPPNLIDRNKMIRLITEIQLAESAIGLQPFSHTEAVIRFKKYEGEIFKKYQVDSATYFTSYQYYAAKGKLLQYIYLIVGDSITAQQKRAEKIARLDSAKRADSLQRKQIDSLLSKKDSIPLKIPKTQNRTKNRKVKIEK
jgi:hypothetical protein